MTDVGQLTYTVDARTEGLLRAEKEVKSSTGRMEKTLDRVDSAVERFDKSIDKLAAELKLLAISQSSAASSAKQVDKAHREAAASTDALNRSSASTVSSTAATSVAATTAASAIDREGREARGSSADLNSYTGATEKATKSTDSLSGSARKASASVGQADRSFDSAGSSLARLAPLVAAVSSGLAVQRVIQYADAWTNAQNSIRQVTDSQQQLAQVTDRLLAVANDSRTSFGATSELYGRLARSTQGLGVSQDRLIRLTETINKGFAASGATAQEAENAIVQLGQGLASGALRGEEFNSVAEQAPVILRAVAAQTGKTVGELRDFAAQGSITADLLIKSLESYADTVESDFSKAVATFGQQTTVANNNLTEFIGNSQAVRTAVSSAGSTLVYLSENIDDVASVASLAATAIGVRLVQALSASIARQAASAVGATSLTAAYSTMGARAATTAVAVRGLSAAMAVVGGPAGVAILAATALFTYRKELDGMLAPAQKAKKAVSELTGEIDRNSRASLQNGIAKFKADIVDLESQAKDARSEIERINDANNTSGPFRNSMVMGAGAEQRKEQFETLQSLGDQIQARKDGIESLEKSLQDLASAGDLNKPGDNNGGSSGGPTDSELKKLKSEFDKVKQELETQRETIEREYIERNETIRKATATGSQQQEDLLARSAEKRKSDLQALSDQLVGITANQIQRINQQYSEQNREILRLTEKGSADQIEALVRNEAQRKKAIEEYRAQELGSLRSHTEQVNAEYRKQQQSILNATQEGSQERVRLQQQAAESYAVTYREAQAKELQDTLNHQQAMKDAELAYQAARIQQMTGFTAEASARLAEFQANSADPARFISESFQNAFTQLDDTIATTFTNGIRQGESFGEIMANVGRSIVADLLQSLVKLGVQMAINAAIGQSAQGAAVAGAAASGASMAAAYAPAAALASLASFGANAAPASAALASTVALSQGLALAGGRQYGGNVNAGSMYRVTEDGKPEMYSDGSRSYLLPGRNGKVTANKDMASGGQTVVQNHIQLIGKGAESARVNQTRDSAGNQVTQILLADMQENGPISRGFTQNFNTSRRGN